jgi:hypothetical protein
MRRFFAAVVIVATAVSLHATERSVFDRFFTEGALRVDLYHTGGGGAEYYSLDELVKDPHWAGNPRALIDTLNLGEYMVRAFDVATNMMVYARGFSTVFAEWETTGEAESGLFRTFHESLILPYPRSPLQIRVERRDRGNIFRTVFDLVVDPADFHIRTGGRYGSYKVRRLEDNGPPAAAVDIVILGDGYRSDQVHKLREDARRFIELFFDTEPFSSRRDDFNVRLIETTSRESGIDDPRAGVFRDNLLGLSFNSLDIDRYVLTLSNKIVREIAGSVPYDQIIILANTEKYGGGGIFNLYSTCISDNEYDGYVFVHEFGHAFAGLGDEYYTSAVTYNDMYPRGVEPWEPNITALLDTTNVKWGDLIAEGTPVPTPDDSTYNDVVGCFEGAGYSAEGLYRPARECRMFTKGLADFCPVCRRAIERMIDFHTR